MGFLGLWGKKKASRMLTCDCGHVIKGGSDDEVMKLAGEHSEKVHNKKVMPEEAEKFRKMIKSA